MTDSIAPPPTPATAAHPLRLGLDLDGVFVDWNGQPGPNGWGFARLLTELTGRDLFPKPGPFTPTTWSWFKALGYKPSELDKAWAHINRTPGWWLGLPPVDIDNLDTAQTLTLVDRLCSAEQVLPTFLTQRPSATAHWQSVQWLVEQGLHRPQVCITSNPVDKALLCRTLRLDVLVDDYYENLDAVFLHAPDTRRVLLARPWNLESLPRQMLNGTHIVYSQPELRALIQRWTDRTVIDDYLASPV